MCVRERQTERERARERKFKKEWQRMPRKTRNARKYPDRLSGCGGGVGLGSHVRKQEGHRPQGFTEVGLQEIPYGGFDRRLLRMGP